jgi:hypothetical protein
MARFGLADRWAYRFPWQSQWYGASEARRREMLSSADLLINVSGCLADPAAHRGAGRLVYIDSDPVFTQVKLARGQADFRASIDAHDVQFSFGEALDGSPVPDTGHCWLPTRQPVLLDEWRGTQSPTRPFTTVMNWSSYNAVAYGDVRYGQKDVELMRFVELPKAVAPIRLELALGKAGKQARAPLDLLAHKGWSIVSPDLVAPDLDRYRDYVRSSAAEWSVAKNGYVQGQAGWFSCRSACYLAAGRPVVVQDTGFGRVLPTGEGLLAFATFDEAVQAITEVHAHWPRHSAAALEVAAQCFDSGRVLASLIERAMATSAAAQHRGETP